MKYLFLILSIVIMACGSSQEPSFDQNMDNYEFKRSAMDSNYVFRPHEEHIQALRDHSIKISNKSQSCASIQDSFFVDHIISTKLSNPEFKKYISYKPWLEPITARIGDTQGMFLADSTSKGDEYRIELLVTEFDSSEHEIVMDGKNVITTIDGYEPFGAKQFRGKYPERRMDYIKIIYNGEEIMAPPSCTKKFYDPKISTFRLPQTMAEAYINGDYLYVYFFGGKGPNAYMAKLIFLKGHYVMSIVSEYKDIGCFGLFSQQENMWY